MAKDVLVETSRADLRAGACTNIHSAWSEDPWVPAKVDLMVSAIKQLGVGLVRDAMFVRNKQAQSYYSKLSDAGVGLLLNVPDARTQNVVEDVTYAATQPWAKSIQFFAGRNEPNSNGGDGWPAATVAVQKDLFDTAKSKKDKFPSLLGILGPAVKHEHVEDYDADLRKAAEEGIAAYTCWFNGRYGPCLDMHFYPGIAGPIKNLAEKTRAEQGYGDRVDWHSETGWTDDTKGLLPQMKALFCIEAYLRNRFNGFTHTSLYQLSYDSTGKFGLVYPDGSLNDAGLTVAYLLNRTDGDPIADRLWWSYDTPTKVPYVATTQSNGSITVYLIVDSPVLIELVSNPGYAMSGYSPNVGPNGNLHWQIPLTGSLVQLDFLPT